MQTSKKILNDKFSLVSENREKFRMKIIKFRNISYFTLRLIAIISAVCTIVFLKENKAISLAIILLIYINLTMSFKWVSYNFTTLMMWKLLDRSIDKIESDGSYLEDILNEYDDFKVIVGKHYGEIVSNLKQSLVKTKSSIIASNKNERMNIELVSNVTSKLEVPMETIIKNIKLIKENELDNINEGILKELREKANNLKKIIDELFEASKVASGDIKIETQEIDIASLLRQALIEFKDEIDKSSVNFKVNLIKDKVFIRCNGEKMWRVFGILIENTLKHSLENSRVYIDLEADKHSVNISFKNTSKDELNIKPEELFKVINSKNQESSGLALEIAKNLIILQQGKFNLDIEADLFKINISFDTEDEAGGGEYDI